MKNLLLTATVLFTLSSCVSNEKRQPNQVVDLGGKSLGTTLHPNLQPLSIGQKTNETSSYKSMGAGTITIVNPVYTSNVDKKVKCSRISDKEMFSIGEKFLQNELVIPMYTQLNKSINLNPNIIEKTPSFEGPGLYTSLHLTRSYLTFLGTDSTEYKIRLLSGIWKSDSENGCVISITTMGMPEFSLFWDITKKHFIPLDVNGKVIVNGQ